MQTVPTISKKTASAGLKPPSFCVVLPVYNEEAGIESCVKAIAHQLKSINTRTAVITVDDGSQDNTAAILKKLRAQLPELIVETHERNAGYGQANRTGFKAALREEFDYALVMDADGTQDPRFVLDFYQVMQQGVDMIKATRYIQGSKVEGVDWRRRAISFWGNKLAKALLPVPLTDYTNGFRALSSQLMRQLHTNERGFSMLIEEVSQARACGATFAETPYVLTVRAEDGSKSKFTYSTNVYMKYLGYLVKRTDSSNH